MRTPTEYIHGHFCKDCSIGDKIIFGWYNEHGIVKINVKPYAKIGIDRLEYL